MQKQYFPREDEARIAAIQTGLQDHQFEVISSPRGFTFRKRKEYKKVENAKLHVNHVPQTPPQPVVEEVVNLTTEKRLCPECKRSVNTFISADDLRYIEHKIEPSGTELCNMSEEIVVSVQTTGLPHTEFKPHELAQIQNGAIDSVADELYRKTHNQRGEKIPTELPKLNKSIVAGPTKLVWEIADQMLAEDPNSSRKDIINRCLAAGIAFATARTQYQCWKKVRKESAEHAAQAPTIKVK
jgi:hypothetical protein